MRVRDCGGPDVVVLGLGPAGRAVAHRAAAAGLVVRAYDPAPDRGWQQSFGAWVDELPAWLPPRVIGARCWPTAIAHTEHSGHREYAMLDTPALQHALAISGVDVRAVASSPADHPGARVIDARGAGSRRGGARQTAFGVFVSRGLHPERWMDWRPAPGVGKGAPASFLYAVPVSQTHMLLEETCLAGDPPLDLAELQRRLSSRFPGLADAGLRTEAVDFALSARSARDGAAWGRVGISGTTLHPATGYSVAASLRWSDLAVAALRSGARVSGRQPAHALRRAGLRTLLALTPSQQRDFFELFFTLPAGSQAAYLDPLSSGSSVAMAMARVFAAAPADLRRVMIAASLRH